MAFNFGSSSTSTGGGGFSFGATPSTTSAAPPASGGFSFGTPSGQQPQTGSFGTPSGQQPQTGSFGTPSGQQPQTGSFGTPSGQQPQTGGFGTQPQQNVGFGTPQAQNTGFGNQQPNTGVQPAPSGIQQPQSGGFSFGGGSAATSATKGGFSFGTQSVSQAITSTQQQSSGGFAFAMKPTPTASIQPGTTAATPNLSFGLGSTAQPQATSTAGLNLTNKPTGTAGFNFAGISGPSTATTTPASTSQQSALAGLLSAPTTAPALSTGTSLFASAMGGPSTGQTISLGGGVKPFSSTGPTAAATTTVNPTLILGVVKTTAPTLSLAGSGTSTSGITLGGTAATTPFKLGGTATTSATVATTTSATTGGIGLSSLTATTSSTAGTFGLPATTTSGASLSTVTNTTSSTTTPQSINYRQLEEQINKWSLELEEQEKIFIQQATQVNAWDRLLIDNGDKIAQLNTDVEKVKLDQQHLDQELDFISAQQKELEELLIPLEQAVEQIPPIHYQQHADLEREHTYKLAENIDAQLKRMVQDLKEIIDHINTSNSTQDNSDPVQQIAKVLNAHMDSLQWIDQNTVLLQRRVDEVTKVSEQRKKEQERNFRLAYD